MNGTYLVTDPGGFPCGRIPFELTPCPLCEHRPSFTRGLQRVTPKMVVHSAPPCRNPEAPVACAWCPFGKMIEAETAALMWIGDRFYSPASFQHEAATLGVSRRVPWPLPKWFKVGATWVLCAHIEAIEKPLGCDACAGAGKAPKPPQIEDCEECQGTGIARLPGVFFAFVPRRIERIVPDTMPAEERAALEAQGLTLVTVPAEDPDHRPSKRQEEE